jgi:hypothetical protein
VRSEGARDCFEVISPIVSKTYSRCVPSISLRKGRDCSLGKHHELVMHKNSEQKNNRQRDADQPEKCTFSKAHF